MSYLDPPGSFEELDQLYEVPHEGRRSNHITGSPGWPTSVHATFVNHNVGYANYPQGFCPTDLTYQPVELYLSEAITSFEEINGSSSAADERHLLSAPFLEYIGGLPTSQAREPDSHLPSNFPAGIPLDRTHSNYTTSDTGTSDSLERYPKRPGHESFVHSPAPSPNVTSNTYFEGDKRSSPWTTNAQNHPGNFNEQDSRHASILSFGFLETSSPGLQYGAPYPSQEVDACNIVARSEESAAVNVADVNLTLQRWVSSQCDTAYALLPESEDIGQYGNLNQDQQIGSYDDQSFGQTVNIQGIPRIVREDHEAGTSNVYEQNVLTGHVGLAAGQESRSPQSNFLDVPVAIQSKAKRGGRPLGSHLLDDDAVNAVLVRRAGGACWRCALNKSKCSIDETCQTCQAIMNSKGGFRRWDLGCLRGSLITLVAAQLFPDCLVKRLEPASIESFLRSNVNGYRGNQFTLTLNVGFGKDFTLLGREFEPKSDEAYSCRVLYTDVASGKTIVRNPASLSFIATWAKESEALRKLDGWVRTTLEDEESMRQWFHNYFPLPQHSWIRSIVAEMWRYAMECDIFRESARYDHAKNDPERILRIAWKMNIVVIALTNQIHIPAHAFPSVVENLDSWAPGRISSRPVNKCVKYLFLKLFCKFVGEVFRGLDRLLKSSSEWGYIFCITVLSTMVVGRMQEALIDNKLLAEQDEKDIRALTTWELHSMEQSLRVLTGLFHAKFKTTNGSKSGNPFRNIRLVARDERLREFVSRVKDEREQRNLYPGPASVLQLHEIPEQEFFYFNTARVIEGFLMPFFEERQPKARRRLQVSFPNRSKDLVR